MYTVRSDTMPEPEFGSTTSRAAQAMNLIPLHRLTLPRGVKEIRMWIGFGLGVPYAMVRIVHQGDPTAGQLYIWLERWPDPAAEWPALIAEMARFSGRHGCRNAGGPDPNWAERANKVVAEDELWYTACRADLAPGVVDWASMWERLRRNHAFDLPDPQIRCQDGTTPQVEFPSGTSYRSYAYCGSDDSEPHADPADSIMNIALSVGAWAWSSSAPSR